MKVQHQSCQLERGTSGRVSRPFPRLCSSLTSTLLTEKTPACELYPTRGFPRTTDKHSGRLDNEREAVSCFHLDRSSVSPSHDTRNTSADSFLEMQIATAWPQQLNTHRNSAACLRPPCQIPARSAFHTFCKAALCLISSRDSCACKPWFRTGESSIYDSRLSLQTECRTQNNISSCSFSAILINESRCVKGVMLHA